MILDYVFTFFSHCYAKHSGFKDTKKLLISSKRWWFHWSQTVAGSPDPVEHFSPLPAGMKVPLDELFPLSPHRLSHGLCFKNTWKTRQMNKALTFWPFWNPQLSFKPLRLLLKPISPHPETVSELSSAMLTSVFSHHWPLRACLSLASSQIGSQRSFPSFLC